MRELELYVTDHGFGAFALVAWVTQVSKDPRQAVPSQPREGEGQGSFVVRVLQSSAMVLLPTSAVKWGDRFTHLVLYSLLL